MSDFPAEILSSGSVFEYEPDVLGRKTLYIRTKYSPVCKETREICKQFGLFLHLKMEEETGEKGYVSITDFAGMTMSNVDIKLVLSTMEVVDVFPPFCILFVCVNIPFILKSLVKSVVYLIPTDHTKGLIFPDKKQLEQVVLIENMPDFLGGTRMRPYMGKQVVPEGCLTFREQFDKLIEDNKDCEFIADPPLMLSKVDKESICQVTQYYEGLFSKF